MLLAMAASASWLSNARAQGQAQTPQPRQKEEEPLAIAARKPDPTWEFDTSVAGRLYELRPVNSMLNGGFSGTRESLVVGMTHFLAPLVDDGSPYSLRPYLQRTTSWSISTDIGHFANTSRIFAGDRTSTWSDVDGALNIYVKRWLAVFASVGYQYDVLHDGGVDQSTHTLYGGAGLAFRTGDLRATVAYDFQAYRQSGSWASPRRQLAASLFGVFARRVSLDLSGSTVTGGGSGRLALEYFFYPDFGVFGSGSVSHGELYQSAVIATRYLGTFGTAAWSSSSTGIVVRYSRMVEHVPMQVIGNLAYGDDETSNQLTLEVYLRFR